MRAQRDSGAHGNRLRECGCAELSVRSGPVRKNCAARTGSIAEPVSNLMQSRQENRAPKATGKRIPRRAAAWRGCAAGRAGCEAGRRGARRGRRDTTRVGGVRGGPDAGAARPPGPGPGERSPGLPTTQRSAVGTVMTLRIRAADPALPGLRFTAPKSIAGNPFAYPIRGFFSTFRNG